MSRRLRITMPVFVPVLRACFEHAHTDCLDLSLVPDSFTLPNDPIPICFTSDYIFFDERMIDYARTEPRWKTTLMLIRRFCLAVVLQICWASRVLLLPAFGTLSTVLLLADATSALDIVLNSIAIGFV